MKSTINDLDIGFQTEILLLDQIFVSLIIQITVQDFSQNSYFSSLLMIMGFSWKHEYYSDIGSSDVILSLTT